MTTLIEPDLCVIGAGAAGLTVAAGAAQMGADTVLIEKGRMGGDCLNYGCVPSKSLLAAAHAAADMRHAGRFGIGAQEPAIDLGAVSDHVERVIASIAPQDSVERLEGLGVRVLQAEARFSGPREVVTDGARVRARRFVLATGSSPTAPPVPGLDAVAYHTNETIFTCREPLRHLVIAGGGPIGVELAQAFRNLGVPVTVIEMLDILPRDDPELVDIVRVRLRRDGVRLLERARIVQAEARAAGPAVAIEQGGGTEWIVGSHLLLATGRKPDLEGLGLEAAGIAHGPGGITVDARLRTTNRRVFAIGDAAGGPQLTHVASYHAGIVIRNILFRLPAKTDYRALVRVIYTDPELAAVGLDEGAAQEQEGGIRILRWPFAECDRARAERTTDGLIKVIASRKGRILGAGIVGPHAGELIQPWVLAIEQRLRIGAMAKVMVPYPSLGEVGKRAAGSYFAPTLFSPRTRKIVRLLAKLG